MKVSIKFIENGLEKVIVTETNKVVVDLSTTTELCQEQKIDLDLQFSIGEGAIVGMTKHGSDLISSSYTHLLSKAIDFDNLTLLDYKKIVKKQEEVIRSMRDEIRGLNLRLE